MKIESGVGVLIWGRGCKTASFIERLRCEPLIILFLLLIVFIYMGKTKAFLPKNKS